MRQLTLKFSKSQIWGIITILIEREYLTQCLSSSIALLSMCKTTLSRWSFRIDFNCVSFVSIVKVVNNLNFLALRILFYKLGNLSIWWWPPESERRINSKKKKKITLFVSFAKMLNFLVIVFIIKLFTRGNMKWILFKYLQWSKKSEKIYFGK